MYAFSTADFELQEYECCLLCPKNCGVNRNAGEKGFCGETNALRVSWAGLHFGEEPPVTGKGGSGTVFITGCNLRCSFCQNYQISQSGMGTGVDLEEFTQICLRLQQKGAENINIVTGSHAIPAIAYGLRYAGEHGLYLPAIWNTSAYETEASLEILAPVIDGWLPDIKTFDPAIAEALFKAADYPENAAKAVLKMAEIAPLPVTCGSIPMLGKKHKGVIVRHLALPGCTNDTKRILMWYAQNLKNKTLLSLMTQYTPIENRPLVQMPHGFQNRMLKTDDDLMLKKLLIELDIETGFYQELNPSDAWLPDFNRVQTFSSELSKPVWHWKKGFIE